ncbi:MAG: hypothetical protein JJV98_12895 [Desulfosarcina sp.]|nr:hypothetical protein [Desulfobacterales bacterium]
MEGKVRISIMALLSKDVIYEDIQPFIEEKLGQENYRDHRKIHGVVTQVDGSHRLQIKFSKLIDSHELDESRYLRIANAFRDAGYGDVAWKITPIEPEEMDPENTTSSFPVELFEACLRNDERQDDPLPDFPPEPFGSEAFWKWFDEGDI